MEENEQIKVLFERYLADKCTPDQIRELMAYFNVSEDSNTLRNLISLYFESTEPNNESADRAVKEVYNRILDNVTFGKEVDFVIKRSFLWPYWMRFAAVWILLAVSCGLTIYFLNRSWDHLISHSTDQNSSLQKHTEVTGIGERKKVTLEDGSVVWLNAKSKLTYPVSFEKNRRQVKLEGEAYFEIFRDVHRPFTVESGKVKTKVLGTSFNIHAYQVDTVISVTVLTGKVQVSTSESAIQIVQNQQVKYINGNILKEVDIDAAAQIAWHNGKLQFRNVLLSDAIKTLERNYPVGITYNPGLVDCHVHADFDVDTPVENVVEMLAVSLGGNVIKLGNALYKLEGSCKNVRSNTNGTRK